MARAETEELRAAELKRKLHRTEDIEFIFTNIFTSIRSKLLAIPSRLTRLIIGKTVFQEIYDEGDGKARPLEAAGLLEGPAYSLETISRVSDGCHVRCQTYMPAR